MYDPKLQLIATFVALSVLSGCNQLRNEDAGTLVGGALGALVGSTIGSGDGQIAAAVVGALAGAYLGSNIGRSMDELDHLKAAQSLEKTPTGSTASWDNPDTGARYAVTPTRTYYQAQDTPCRDFTTEAWIDGKRELLKGSACRQPDGTWKAL
jgi:surface antigen